MKSVKPFFALLFAAAIFLTFSACAGRVRTSGGLSRFEEPPFTDDVDPVPDPSAPEETQQPEPESPADEPAAEPPANPQPPAEENPTVQDVPTQENPDAENREYAGDAPAQFDPEGETPIVSQQPEIEAPSAPADQSGSPETGNQESGEETNAQQITQILPQEDAQQQAPQEDAPQADTQLSYFRTLLESVRTDLFECEKFYVYWETSSDYTTVLKTNAEHQIISNAGGYNVSAKLTQDRLTVDDGWISRKNPGVVVKSVDTGVLGSGTSGTASAKALWEALQTRPDWTSLDAVAGQRILILSQELLQTEAGRCAAAVYLAKVMYPEQFAGVDTDEACRLLLEEAGEPAGGVYAFAG